jgi:hypothetical protein
MDAFFTSSGSPPLAHEFHRWFKQIDKSPATSSSSSDSSSSNSDSMSVGTRRIMAGIRLKQLLLKPENAPFFIK